MHFLGQANNASDIKLKSTFPPFFKLRNVSILSPHLFKILGYLFHSTLLLDREGATALTVTAMQAGGGIY